MISRLEGKVAAKGEDHLVVQVGGLGFKVYVSPSTRGSVEVGEEMKLDTHLHVRENELSLYGFQGVEELAFFHLLLSVPSIGPKSALNILSSTSLKRLSQAIATEDVAALTRIPGIGRKTAERIILDLKDKVVVEELPPAVEVARYDPQAVEALISLGYNAAEARAALERLPEEKLSLEDQILWALRYLGA